MPNQQTAQQHELSWQKLPAVVDAEMLAAPRIDWSVFDHQTVNYLAIYVADSPWINHLVLLAGVCACHAHLSPKYAHEMVHRIHLRLRTIFQAYHLTHLEEWN